MSEILFASLIHLIQHPDLYQGKRIRVVGFASLAFESKAIYVSQADYEHAVTKNALWLAVELDDRVRAKHERYIIVEGVFNSSNLGHLKLYSGSIEQIDRLDLWDSADQPKR